jgi:hypothetical protein
MGSVSMAKSLIGRPESAAAVDLGLLEFWSEWRSRAARSELASPTTLAALDEWFERGNARCLLSRPRNECYSVVATWVQSLVARQADVEVLYLPVSRRLGTASERKALQLLYGQLDQQVRFVSNPRSMDELRSAFGLCLGRDEEGPMLLVVIDALEHAVGWGASQLGWWVRNAGEGVRILVVADVEVGLDGPSGVEFYLEELDWERDATDVIEHGLEARPQTSRASEVEPRLTHLRFILQPLSAALAPILTQELERYFSVDLEALGGVDTNAEAWRSSVHSLESGQLLLSSDCLQARLLETWGTQALDAALVARVRQDVEHGRSDALTEYAVRTTCLHMSRLGEPYQGWRFVVTAGWLSAWSKFDDALSGYLGDLELARKAAENEIGKQCETEGTGTNDTLVDAIGLYARVVACQAVLLEKEGSRHNKPSFEGPYTQPRLNLTAPIKLRSMAAALLLGLEREAPERAHELQHLLGSGPAAYGRPVQAPPRAFWRSVCERQITDEDIEVIRAAGNAYTLGWPPLRGAGAACLALGEERAWELAEATTGAHRAESFADLARYVSPAKQHQAVVAAMDAYFDHGDSGSRPWSFSCAAWMSRTDAALLMGLTLGRDPEADLERTFIGPGGILDCAALIMRIGGPGAVVAVAEQVCEVVHWLGQEDAGE